MLARWYFVLEVIGEFPLLFPYSNDKLRSSCTHLVIFWLLLRVMLNHGNLSVAEQENCLFMLAAFLRKLLLEARKYEGQVQHTLLGEASPALLTRL